MFRATVFIALLVSGKYLNILNCLQRCNNWNTTEFTIVQFLQFKSIHIAIDSPDSHCRLHL